MTKKDFILIADAVRKATPLQPFVHDYDGNITYNAERRLWKHVCNTLAEALAETGDSFNYGRFIAACEGVTSKKRAKPRNISRLPASR